MVFKKVFVQIGKIHVKSPRFQPVSWNLFEVSKQFSRYWKVYYPPFKPFSVFCFIEKYWKLHLHHRTLIFLSNLAGNIYIFLTFLLFFVFLIFLLISISVSEVEGDERFHFASHFGSLCCWSSGVRLDFSVQGFYLVFFFSFFWWTGFISWSFWWCWERDCEEYSFSINGSFEACWAWWCVDEACCLKVCSLNCATLFLFSWNLVLYIIFYFSWGD